MSLMANREQGYYFSEKLKERLRKIRQYPLTIVEAPSGFGKTTAVREYLRSELPHAVSEWYTCLGEPALLAWEEICALFSGVNSAAADGMRRLKLPTMDTLPRVKTYLKNLDCGRETYLVIDNYQLINFDIHHELLHVFSMHGSPNLHLIFIMQQLPPRQRLPVHNDNIYVLDAAPFFFDREGVAALFRMEGLRPAEDEIEHIFRSTEGWISAVRLQMIHYRETGSLVYPAGMEKLVETAIWNRLTSAEKDFLLAVSVFDSFTAPQAAAMVGEEADPGEIEDGLKASEFIRFLPDKRLFIIHGILLDYLRSRFWYHQSREYRDRIFHRAGMSCAAIGRYCIAAQFFYQAGDFKAILSLPITRKCLDSHRDECGGDMFVRIIRDCPEEALREHPFTAAVFAHYALLSGWYELYERLCLLLHHLIREEGSFTLEELCRLTGEVILLESLAEFNDLSKMSKGYAAAGELLGESSDIMEGNTPWLSLFPTAVGIFWREPGQLDAMLETVDGAKSSHRMLGRGQGAGMGHLTRAEAMLMRGKDGEAELLCRKALYEARARGQVSVCIYTELCLARISMLRGDPEGFTAAMGNIRSYGETYADQSVRRMADMCMSILGLLLGIKDYVAPWVYHVEDIRKSMYAPLAPFAEVLYSGLLLLDRRYSELYAVAELALDALRQPGAKVKYVMPQMYHLIFLAVAKYNSGNDSEAERYIKKALDTALPDRVYLPFADHTCMSDLLGLVRLCRTNREDCTALLALCRRRDTGVSAIQRALLKRKSPLTPREREIALLARGRMSAREIASELYISEATVKSTLRSVYSKLNIHSRRELSTREF